MARIRLVSWSADDADDRAAFLRSRGHDVDASQVALVRELPEAAVDPFVIDLARLPSRGRDVGVMLRREVVAPGPDRVRGRHGREGRADSRLAPGYDLR